MATIILDWQVAGDVQLRRALPRVAIQVEDMRAPLRRAGSEVIYPATRRQFAAEGDPSWPELSPAYARRKAQRAPGAKILHLTGALEHSLTDQRASGAVYRLERLLLEIGSNLMVGSYNLALIHYAPERAPVPARKMMRLAPDDQTHIVTIFDDWLSETLRREGIEL